MKAQSSVSGFICAIAISILLNFSPKQSIAQPNLLPSIGIGDLPSDSDPVCKIPLYLGSFYTSGLQAADTAYNFTLYNLNGDSLNLKSALSKGRPVLLIAGSYTCPVYRNKVKVINDLINTYAGLLDVYIIYTIEAHPDIDTSVYYGYEHTGTQNISEGILYRQPTTYGERKVVVSDMLSEIATLAPVFIDGPCNNWWEKYGPAPNNAYLIDTTGIIFAKHGWFDRYPDNIYCDIDSLLGTNSGKCTSIGGTGNFTFQLTSADTIYEEPGTTISVDGELQNTGPEDILIYARRIENNIPSGWGSAMCIDVCYSTATDSVVFLLPAGSTQSLHIYFFTSSSLVDTGHVKIGLKNLGNTSNNNFVNAYGITANAAVSKVYSATKSNNYFSLSPNPFSFETILKTNESFKNATLTIYNLYGQQVKELKNISGSSIPLYRDNLPKGIYFVCLRQNSMILGTKKLIITD